MTYQQTLDWMFAQLPMYQRQGKTAFKKDFTNILAFSKELGSPEDKFKSIHVGGTNGKLNLDIFLRNEFVPERILILIQVVQGIQFGIIHQNLIFRKIIAFQRKLYLLGIEARKRLC